MRVTIGEICTLKSGTSLKEDVLSDKPGVLYVKVSDMNLAGNEKYIVDTNAYAINSISDKLIFPKGTILFPKRGGAIGTNKKRITSTEVCADLNTMGVIPGKMIRPLFLYYYFQNIDMGSLYNGSSVPQINNSDIAPLKLDLPSLQVQDEAIIYFERIDCIIRSRKTELEKLDELIKARFVEMFGDPETNPKNWVKKPLSTVISAANNGMARRGNDKEGNIVMRLVELQDGYIDYSNPNRIVLTEAEKKRYLLIDKDFLFARVNGNPENVGRCAVFYDIGEPVFHNDHIIRVHFDDKVLDGPFASALLNSEYGKRQLKNQIKTSAGQYTVSQDGIGAIVATLPPIEFQLQFAAFVAQVDKSKNEVQKSLDEAHLLFDSLMQQYFG